MTDGYLSRNRNHLARLQRERRARMVRIDYMPSEEARETFLTVQATKRPGSQGATKSAVLDAIVIEWAKLTGINKHREVKTKSSAPCTALCVRKRTQAHEFGEHLTVRAAKWFETHRQPSPTRRVPCHARRHRDGQPCQALSEPGKQRCRFHGGRSTGPRSEEGKIRALANLKQFRK